MRRAALAGIVAAALPTAAVAQPLPYRATVADAEVVLRAGPGDRFPETGAVARGTSVEVHEDAGNGWVGVAAPRAVSWVPIQFVDFDPAKRLPQEVTTQGEVQLAPGRAGVAQPFADIRRVTVPAGTILTVIGEKATVDGKSWYPVMAAPGDYRYVPKTSVQAAGPANTSFVVRDTPPAGLPPVAPTPPAVQQAGGTRPEPAAKAVSNHPLFAQAEAAERDGRFDDAERTYFQLARQMNEPGGDHDLANLCYTRIHAIRERKQRAATAVTAPPASLPNPAPRTERPTLLPPVTQDARPPQPVAPPRDPQPPVADGTPRWSGVGMLTRSALALDGRRTYALESSPGVVRAYVVGGAGVDLERYVNRRVDLHGTTLTRRDLSKPYIVVTDVNPNP